MNKNQKYNEELKNKHFPITRFYQNTLPKVTIELFTILERIIITGTFIYLSTNLKAAGLQIVFSILGVIAKLALSFELISKIYFGVCDIKNYRYDNIPLSTQLMMMALSIVLFYILGLILNEVIGQIPNI